MKVTVTTTTQTLLDILSTGQLAQAKESKRGVFFQMVLQNNHGTVDIYAENKDDATLADSTKIQAAVGTLNIMFRNLADISLIADTSSNDDIRLMFL